MHKISVIIPTYNRCQSIKDTLSSLLTQEGNGNFDYEVIIVDNNSKDNTKVIIDSFTPKFSKNLRYIFEPRQGKSYAMNSAISVASGDIIAFTDDDCLPEKDWLRNIAEKFKKNSNLDCVLGEAIMSDGTKMYDDNNPLRGNGLNMAIRRGVFDNLGFFDVFLGAGSIGYSGEDTEFIYRLLKNRRNIIICNDIKVVHKIRPDFKNTVKFAYRDSKGLMIFWLKYIIKKRDLFALKNIFWFFKDTGLKIVIELRNKNKKRIVLKISQLFGAIFGLVKGAIIWIIIEPIDALCLK